MISLEKFFSFVFLTQTLSYSTTHSILEYLFDFLVQCGSYDMNEKLWQEIISKNLDDN